MQKRLIELQLERARLSERAAGERRLLTSQTHGVKGTFSLGSGLRDALAKGQKLAAQHPVLLGLVVAAVVIVRPRRLIGGLGMGLRLWRLWKTIGRELPPGWVDRFFNAERKAP